MTEPSEAAMQLFRDMGKARLSAVGKALRSDCELTYAEILAIADKAAALVIDRAMGAGEPVAWMYERDTLGRTGLFQERLPEQYRSAYQIETALYAHPAPDTAALVEIIEDMLVLLEMHYPNPAPNGQINRARALIAQHKGTEHG